jgi:hypothetical protein
MHSFISNTGKGISTLSVPAAASGDKSSGLFGSVDVETTGATSVDDGASTSDVTGITGEVEGTADNEGKDCNGSTDPSPDPGPVSVAAEEEEEEEVEAEALILEDRLLLVGGTTTASSMLLLLGTSTMLLLLLLGAVVSTMGTEYEEIDNRCWNRMSYEMLTDMYPSMCENLVCKYSNKIKSSKTALNIIMYLQYYARLLTALCLLLLLLLPQGAYWPGVFGPRTTHWLP